MGDFVLKTASTPYIPLSREEQQVKVNRIARERCVPCNCEYCVCVNCMWYYLMNEMVGEQPEPS